MRHFNQVCIGGICLAFLALPVPCAAQQATVVKIEEDWEMVIHQPDPATNSPQVTFFVSPSVETESTYFQLQLNYAADEWFDEGGFHVAAVDQGGIIDEARSSTRAILSTDGDTIRWTSVMASLNGKLLFAVKDGHSVQWGDFGGPEYLVRIPGSPHVDLANYHHSQSLNSVDIGFGGNRVSSITLKQVRLFYSDGHTSTVDVNSHP